MALNYCHEEGEPPPDEDAKPKPKQMFLRQEWNDPIRIDRNSSALRRSHDGCLFVLLYVSRRFPCVKFDASLIFFVKFV